MSERLTSGGCLCGAVRIEARGEPRRVGICHCMDCRKHHDAPFYSAAIFPEDAVTATGETRHSNHRHFCPTCGGSVYAQWDDEIEVHLGALDEPSQFTPDLRMLDSAAGGVAAGVCGDARVRGGSGGDGAGRVILVYGAHTPPELAELADTLDPTHPEFGRFSTGFNRRPIDLFLSVDSY